jgi:protein FRG1
LTSHSVVPTRRFRSHEPLYRSSSGELWAVFTSKNISYHLQKYNNLNNYYKMGKLLTFKGDKKPKKRKRVDVEEKFGEPSSSKELTAGKPEDEAPADDDSWVTAEATGDVVGPIILVLPSEPPTCIACDTNGKVFASELENVVDGDPSTAEPHDVRQVWVANRVAGTETFSFKGHHGR